MKSIIKLLTITFFAAVLLILSPQLPPRVSQVFPPPEIHQPKKPVAPPPGAKHLQKVEDLVLELTNKIRRSKGLAPLCQDEELRQVARAYSNDMLVRRFFSHTTPDGVTFDERISDQYPHGYYVVGENLWSSYGYNPNRSQQLAQEIVNSWMNSPGHRANLLGRSYTHLGVGISAHQDRILATQEFVGKSRAFSFGELIKLIRAKVQGIKLPDCS